VLFVDVKSSVEMSEQLDLEEWHRILDRFFQILAEGVHRFEGTINQYTGDGIMALFGAPIAHEDHAQRACYAALALRDALRGWCDELRLSRGLGLSVRMGINSGEVVVGKIGDDLRMDYTAQGHTVGLAQRMEALAEARTICLSDRTARLVSGWFTLRDLGVPTLKGVSEPVRVYELEGVGEARTRLDTSRARGFSKFVGRDAELSAVVAALERASAGRGGVIGVVADAGTGKSRLCHEFTEHCRAQGVLVRHTWGVAHGKTIAFLPVLDLLRQVFGIGPRDSEREARQKIAGTLVLADENLRDEIPLLLDFLGVPDPQRPAPTVRAEVRQRRLLDVVRRFALARGQQEPAVVVVFEDLHWIDPASEAFVAALAGAAEGARLLLLVNFRPEYRADWMGRTWYQQIALRPLDAAAVEEMLGEWLGQDASLRGLAARICARTGGTPFFVEEVVQSLIESGALAGARGAYRLTRRLDELQIPATVQALLAARIDRLGEREKRVLQTAAVIGKEFSRSLLARVAELAEEELDAALQALMQAEFLYEQALYPELEYAFKHPLTQEVAQRSQLRERRAHVHAAVAKALEEIHAGQLDEKAGLLAHHWEEAGEPLVAARWHLCAARWSGGRHVESSVSHLEAVLRLADAAPESEERLRLGVEARALLLSYAARSRRVAEQYEKLSREGEEFARRLGDERARALLIQGRVFSSLVLASPRGLGGALVEAIAIADRLEDLDLRVALRHTRAMAAWSSGEQSTHETLRAAEEGIALAGGRTTAGFAVTGINPVITLWASRGVAESMQGRREDARRSFERAIDLARQLEDVIAEAPPRNFIVSPFGCEDLVDPGTALRHAERLAEIAERTGATGPELFARWALGVACWRNERLEEAASHLERMLAYSEEQLAMLGARAFGNAELAQVWLALDPKRARGAIERALALRSVCWDGPRIDLVDARVRLACGEREAAAAALARGRALMRRLEAPSYEPEFDRVAAALGA
jgi:class 3 adenylate cyclase/tetratricopeptide (TPR) repeat protein